MNAAAPVIQFDSVCAGYRGHPVLKNFSLTLEAGACVALLGPNGVGKTTFLQVANGLIPCQSGTVRLFGEPVAKMPAARRARLVGVVSQELTTPMAFTVGEMVMMGRTAHLGRWAAPAAVDREAVAQALAMTDTLALQQRSYPALSSGERQRVAMAMALAGEPRLLLLDEATSHLDMSHRLEVVNLIRRINAERKLTVVMIVHDLNLAAEYFPRITLLSEGRVVADGAPDAVLREPLLRQVYGCQVTVRRDAEAGCLRVFPRSANRSGEEPSPAQGDKR
jgi:iron complex transport system ATP-binding protein